MGRNNRTNDPTGDTMTLRLQEAIDRLQEDVRRVEIWAGALSGFLKPVPDYDAHENRHALSRREPRLTGHSHDSTNGPGHDRMGAPVRFSAPFRDA